MTLSVYLLRKVGIAKGKLPHYLLKFHPPLFGCASDHLEGSSFQRPLEMTHCLYLFIEITIIPTKKSIWSKQKAFLNRLSPLLCFLLISTDIQSSN